MHPPHRTAPYLFDGEAPRLAGPCEVVVARVDPALQRAGHGRERELRPPQQRLLLLVWRLRGVRRSGSIPVPAAAARSLPLLLPPPPRPPPPPLLLLLLLLPPTLVRALLPFSVPVPRRRRLSRRRRRLGPGRLSEGLMGPGWAAEEPAEVDE